MDSFQYVKWFRGASPYINLHRDRTFVLMLGGDAIAHPNFDNFIHDVALLHSLDVRLVIVFGARLQIDAALEAAQIETHYHRNLRITDQATLAIVRRVVGDLRMQIEAKLSMGLPGTPMQASRINATGGNWVTAKPVGIVDGVDHALTGEVRRVDAEGLKRQLDAGCIPLIGPFGYSPSGEVFNVAYEEVAASVSSALRADKLIALDDEPGLLDGSGNLISEMSPGELDLWLDTADDGSPAGSERHRQASALLWAVRSGVRRCHVVSHAEDGALIAELFTREGQGTQITEHSAERIRQANLDDVAGIIDLTAPLEANGVLLPRTRERIEREITQFWVLDLDGMIIACAALYPHADSGTAEIACVVTHRDYQGGDRAERLIRHLEGLARRQGMHSTFVLTTRTAAWFMEQGYAAGDLDDLPDLRRVQWTPERNSRVLVKPLTTP
jgi:amino-acid N-acetyltransferase